jgi:hypothetical protein
MPRSEGDTKMTPLDDELARLLVGVGYSYRQVGTLLGRDDKTIASGVDRAKTGKSAFTVTQLRRAKELLGFHKWLETGFKAGYVKALGTVPRRHPREYDGR